MAISVLFARRQIVNENNEKEKLKASNDVAWEKSILIRGYTLIQNTKLGGLRYLHLSMSNTKCRVKLNVKCFKDKVLIY